MRYATAIAALYSIASPAAAPQSRPLGVPQQLSASRTATGIRITSDQPGNRFSLDLNGKSIQPLSSDALVLLIDGKTVEISSIAVGDTLANMTPEQLLKFHQQWDFEHRQSEGWTLVKGTERMFASDGAQCFSWKLTRPTGQPDTRLTMTTLNGRYVIVLAALADKSTESEMAGYLQSILLSLKRVPDSAPRPKSPVEEGPEMSVGQNVRMMEAIAGKPYRALMNKALITPKDLRLRNRVTLEPEILLMAARAAIDIEGKNASIPTAVFDGRSAHAINLRSYNGAATFDYWDPWGKGSFLTVENNHAGVNATPHPVERRIWVITTPELQRVIYAITLSFEDVLHLNATVPLGAFGALGDRLADATGTDLFTFFHLQRAGALRDAHAHMVISFRPGPAKFAPLVTLNMTVNDKDRILRAQLLVDRSFIDDPQNGVFARDIVKTFLRSTTPRDDVPEILDLANEIELRDLRGHVIISRERAPVLPAQPTSGYLVFSGSSSTFENQLSRSVLILRNRKQATADWFEMTLDTEP